MPMKEKILDIEEVVAAEINRLHAEISTTVRMTLEKAIRIGELLTEQKAKCGHGNWLPWLKANIHFDQKTENNYRRVYRNRDKLGTIPNLKLTEAYQLISEGHADEVDEKNTRRKARTSAPKKHPAAPSVIGLHDQGLNRPEIAQQTGVSSRQVRHIIEEEEIRRSVEPRITPEMLSMSAQQKLEVAIKQHKQKLDNEYHQTVETAAWRYLDLTIERWKKEQAEAKRIIEARKGFMDRGTYKKILACLHPDWVTDQKQKRRYEEAFNEFAKLEKFLLDEKESPTPFMDFPKTRAEWEELRRKTTAERKAKRQQATIKKS